MQVAATRGLLRPVNRNDRNGRLREALLLRTLEREKVAHEAELGAKNEVAKAQFVPGADKQLLFKNYAHRAEEHLHRYRTHTFPWIDWVAPKSPDEAETQEVTEEDQYLWESIYGKLDDEATAEKIKKSVEYLKN